MHRTLLIALAVLLPAVALQAAEPAGTAVFESGTDGYHTYRIPALLVTEKGTALAFCEGRKTGAGDHGDIDMLLKRSQDSGKTWSQQQIVYEEGDDARITIGNPCPVQDRSTGRIWLPFCKNNDTVHLTYSDDEGKTWSKPVEITAQVKLPDWSWYATGPGIGIQLEKGPHKGRLVIPCDHRSKKYGYGAHSIYSDDHGKTWKISNVLPNGPNECQAVELRDGRVLLNARMQAGREQTAGHRGISTSDDGGATWSALSYSQGLADPICQGSLIRGPHDTLLFSLPNDGPAKLGRGRRHQLTLWRSDDEGNSWQKARLIYAGPAAYSSLAVLPDGQIGCLYEGGSKRAHQGLYLATFPLQEDSEK